MTDMKMDAVISPDGRYRYLLERTWDERLPKMIWTALNPSVANGEKNDPTAVRFINFAKRENFGGIYVVNLYGLITPKPRVLFESEDRVGPDNNMWIESCVREVLFDGGLLVAAWGVNAEQSRVREVLNLPSLRSAHIMCLGETQGGHPKHPLYLAKDTTFRLWTRPAID